MGRYILTLLTASALAFFVGRGTAGPPPPGGAGDRGPPGLEAEVRRLERELAAARGGSRERPRAVSGEIRPEREAPRSDPVPVHPAPGDRGADPSGETARLLAFMDDQLGRGEAGFTTLLRELGREDRREAFVGLLDDAGEAGSYPLLRLLVRREREVAAMSEWLLATMAEAPDRLAGIDRELLEIFVERIVSLLPEMTSPDRLAASRDLARRILETPKHLQPEAVRKTRDEVEDLLERSWSEPGVWAGR